MPEEAIESKRAAAVGKPPQDKGRIGGSTAIGSSPFLHPSLFAILPVVSSLAGNIEIFGLHYALRPMLIMLAVAEGAAVVLWKILRHKELAALVTTVFLVLFTSYGHVIITIRFFLGGEFLSPHIYIAPLWVAMFIFVVWAASRERDRLGNFTGIMNATAAIALAVPLIRIGAHEAQVNQLWEPEGIRESSFPRATDDGQMPDIYYIILDGYGREDVLKDVYDFDNAGFLSFLEEHGFFVAGQSRANYAQTVLSLASSLNMEYLGEVAEDVGESSQNVRPLARLVRHNQVRRLLEGLGYTVVALSTGYRRTELEDADLFLRAPEAGLTTLESLLIETSGLMTVYDLSPLLSFHPAYPGYLSHRSRTLFSLRELEEMARIAGPKFVFVHIVIPHPPFVFGDDGQEVVQNQFYELGDASDYLGGSTEYIQRYTAQLEFLNPQIEQVIEKIISSSGVPPIIIIQGDHGPAAHLNWSKPPLESDLRERMTILSAYHLPGVDTQAISNSISPVNTFRVLFNEYFGTQYDLLPDESYYSSTRHPYEFMQVPREVLGNSAVEATAP